jgi:thiol-disulfide isomerase/thioredoxin
MTMSAKRIAGGVLAAALLTVGVRGLVTAPRWLPELRRDFATVVTPQRTVAREGWEYKGADDPNSFLKDVGSLSRDRAVVVMLYRPGCEMCAGLTDKLHEVQDKRLTDLDFDVLKVDVSRYSRITWEMRQGNSTPECFIYCNSKDPVTMNDIPENTAQLVDFLQAIYHKTGGPSVPHQSPTRSP